VNRGEGENCGRAGCEQALKENRSGGFGVAFVAIAGFFGKGAAGQPFQEAAGRDGENAILRKMDMRVDEAGDDKARTVIVEGKMRLLGRKRASRS
jgi:hypothetical protein